MVALERSIVLFIFWESPQELPSGKGPRLRVSPIWSTSELGRLKIPSSAHIIESGFCFWNDYPRKVSPTCPVCLGLQPG